MKHLIYAGSFDPITIGHLDVIARAAKLCDELHIWIPQNVNKKPMFGLPARLKMIAEAVDKLPKEHDDFEITVQSVHGLTAKLAEGMLVEDPSATVGLVRGLRATTDFEAEFQMSQANNNLCNKIESIYLMARPEHMFVSSSMVRELIHFDMNEALKYVPEGAKEVFSEGFRS